MLSESVLARASTRCWRTELGTHHADLRREAAALIAVKPASALLYATAVWWYGCGVGVWACVLWWDERCDGLTKRFVQVFRLTDPIDKVNFSTGSASRIAQSKIVEKKTIFRLFLHNRKRAFSTQLFSTCYTIEKEIFRLNVFALSDSTGYFFDFFDWICQSKKF